MQKNPVFPQKKSSWNMQDPMKVSKTTTVTIFLMDETIFCTVHRFGFLKKKQTLPDQTRPVVVFRENRADQSSMVFETLDSIHCHN
jgi:hypothetical protein